MLVCSSSPPAVHRIAPKFPADRGLRLAYGFGRLALRKARRQHPGNLLHVIPRNMPIRSYGNTPSISATNSPAISLREPRCTACTSEDPPRRRQLCETFGGVERSHRIRFHHRKVEIRAGTFQNSSRPSHLGTEQPGRIRLLSAYRVRDICCPPRT